MAGNSFLRGVFEFGDRAEEFPGCLVDEDLFAADGAECVDLGFGVLVAGGDPRSADPHAQDRNTSLTTFKIAMAALRRISAAPWFAPKAVPVRGG